MNQSRRVRRVRRAFCALGVVLIGACASSPPASRSAAAPALVSSLAVAGSPPPSAPLPSADPSDDWHVLLLEPFGSKLSEESISLHEVLLFHDSHAVGEADRPADADAGDCFAVDGEPPRFVGREPDRYLLCFEHDRLSRIDVAVRLTRDEAAQSFSRLCGLWLKNSAAPVAGNVCEGHADGIAFSGHLNLVPGEPTAVLALTLEALRDPQR